jgi:hypothetical protein
MKKIILIFLLLSSYLVSFSEIEQEDVTKNPLREVTTYTTARIREKAILDLTVEKLNIRGITYSKLEDGNMVFEINKTEGIIPKYLVTTSTDLIPRDIKVNGKNINRDTKGKKLEFAYKEDIENLRDNIYIEIAQNFTPPLYISKLDSKTGKLLEVYEYKEIPKTRRARSTGTVNPGNTTLNSFYLGKMIPGEILEKGGFSMDGGKEYTEWFNGIEGGFENKSMTFNKRDTSQNIPINATVSVWWDIELLKGYTINDVWEFDKTKQLTGVSDSTSSKIAHKVIYAADWRGTWWTSVPQVKLYHGFTINIPSSYKNKAFGLYGIREYEIPGRVLRTSDKKGNIYDITTPELIEFLVQRDPRTINVRVVRESNPIITMGGQVYSKFSLNNFSQHGYSFRFSYNTAGKDAGKGISIGPYDGLLIPTNLPSGTYEIDVVAQLSGINDNLQIGGQPDKIIIEYERQPDILTLKELDLRSFLSNTWGRWKDIFAELKAYDGDSNSSGEKYSFKEQILSGLKFDLKKTKKIKLFKEGIEVANSISHSNGRVDVNYEDLGFGIDGGELLGEFFIDKKGYYYFGDAEYRLDFYDEEDRLFGRMNISVIKDRGIDIGSVSYEVDNLLIDYMKATGTGQFFIGMSDNIGAFQQNKYKDLIIKGSGSYINSEITSIIPKEVVNVTENGTANLGFKVKSNSRQIDRGAGGGQIRISYNRDNSSREVIYYNLINTAVTLSDLQDKIIFNLKTLNESNSYSDSFYTGFQIDDGRVYEMKYEFVKSTKTSYKEASYTIDTTDFQVGNTFDLSTGDEIVANGNTTKKKLTKSGEVFEYSLLGNSNPDMAAFTVEDLASKLSTAGLDNYTIKLEKDSTNRKTLLKIKKNSSVKLENKKLEGKINFYDITVGKITLNISDKGPSFELIDDGELDFGILTYDSYNTYVKGEKIFSVKNPNSYPITFTLQKNSGILTSVSSSTSTIPVENLKITQSKKTPINGVNTFLLEGYAKPYPNMASGEYTGEIMIDITIDTTSSN